MRPVPGDREREGNGCRTQDVCGIARSPPDASPTSGRHCPPAGAETAAFGAGCCSAVLSPNPKACPQSYTPAHRPATAQTLRLLSFLGPGLRRM